jgi:hypothetical protein
LLEDEHMNADPQRGKIVVHIFGEVLGTGSGSG